MNITVYGSIKRTNGIQFQNRGCFAKNIHTIYEVTGNTGTLGKEESLTLPHNNAIGASPFFNVAPVGFAPCGGTLLKCFLSTQPKVCCVLSRNFYISFSHLFSVRRKEVFLYWQLKMHTIHISN